MGLWRVRCSSYQHHRTYRQKRAGRHTVLATQSLLDDDSTVSLRCWPNAHSTDLFWDHGCWPTAKSTGPPGCWPTAESTGAGIFRSGNRAGETGSVESDGAASVGLYPRRRARLLFLFKSRRGFYRRRVSSLSLVSGRLEKGTRWHSRALSPSPFRSWPMYPYLLM